MPEKILLLTGSVPGSAHVGEIIMRDLVEAHGVERFECVAIVPENYQGTPRPQVEGMGFHLLRSPFTHGSRRDRISSGPMARRLRFVTGFEREASRVAADCIEIGRAAQASRIFVVLNNAVLFSVAHRVAKALQVPLVALVWDPPEYLLRQARFDRWSRARLRREFDRSLAASERVAVVSETMRDDYARLTRASIHLLRHGLAGGGRPPSIPLPDDEWIMGFAGSMYSDCAWKALVAALDHADWRIAGRPVRLRLLTGRIELASRRGARIEYMGFRSAEEVQSILQSCHLTYMPQPFVPELAELSRYSFPTKLANYLALGRPVFVHCPKDSALAAFVERNPVGVRVHSLSAALIVSALEELLGDSSRYAEASRAAEEVARAQFSAASFAASVEQFLSPAVAS